MQPAELEAFIAAVFSLGTSSTAIYNPAGVQMSTRRRDLLLLTASKENSGSAASAHDQGEHSSEPEECHKLQADAKLQAKVVQQQEDY